MSRSDGLFFQYFCQKFILSQKLPLAFLFINFNQWHCIKGNIDDHLVGRALPSEWSVNNFVMVVHEKNHCPRSFRISCSKSSRYKTSHWPVRSEYSSHAGWWRSTDSTNDLMAKFRRIHTNVFDLHIDVKTSEMSTWDLTCRQRHPFYFQVCNLGGKVQARYGFE